MIEWIEVYEGSWEGVFQSEVFIDEENGGEFSIYVENSDTKEYAEKCVKSFNGLSDSEIDVICEKIAKFAEKEYDFPAPEKPREILKSCWFTSVWVSASKDKNRIFYVVEGEGDWGDAVGFVMENDKAVYVGADYMECLDEG